jgi:3-hydroxyacyl-[acyl-carrier-protein] dehydratase
MLTNIQIRELIPHRYPFLLVDRVDEIEPGKKCVAVKNVTANEPFFQGHFPGNPIMPGVLIVEALAQASGIAAAILDENKGKLGLFTSIDSMKIRRQVIPGDVLKLEAEIIAAKRGFIKVKVRASVEEQTAAEGQISFVMVDKGE